MQLYSFYVLVSCYWKIIDIVCDDLWVIGSPSCLSTGRSLR
jgi:hypothetical protein